jgi:hypothetical protein
MQLQFKVLILFRAVHEHWAGEFTAEGFSNDS